MSLERGEDNIIRVNEAIIYPWTSHIVSQTVFKMDYYKLWSQIDDYAYDTYLEVEKLTDTCSYVTGNLGSITDNKAWNHLQYLTDIQLANLKGDIESRDEAIAKLEQLHELDEGALIGVDARVCDPIVLMQVEYLKEYIVSILPLIESSKDFNTSWGNKVVPDEVNQLILEIANLKGLPVISRRYKNSIDKLLKQIESEKDLVVDTAPVAVAALAA